MPSDGNVRAEIYLTGETDEQKTGKESELSKLSSYIKQRIIINRIHFTLQEEEIHN